MNKDSIIPAIIEQLTHDRQLLLQAARAAHQAATDPENIPDNKYETLALESSYLAQGQANRARELQLALERYRNLLPRTFQSTDPVYLTALVVIESEAGHRRTLFLGPAAGGLKVEINRHPIMVITPESPLGRDLIGKEIGDVIEIEVNGMVIEYELVEVD